MTKQGESFLWQMVKLQALQFFASPCQLSGHRIILFIKKLVIMYWINKSIHFGFFFSTTLTSIKCGAFCLMFASLDSHILFKSSRIWAEYKREAGWQFNLHEFFQQEKFFFILMISKTFQLDKQNVFIIFREEASQKSPWHNKKKFKSLINCWNFIK